MQVKCTNDPDKPIDLQLWGGDEFTVFTDPEDPRQRVRGGHDRPLQSADAVQAVVQDEVRTYLTDQYSADKTAGARVAYPQNDAEKNTYGCIPFAFLHYRAQVRQFWTPGPGTFLRKAELRINDRLSELDELISKYARPIGSFPQRQPHIHSRDRALADFCGFAGGARATPGKATPTAANHQPSTSRPSWRSRAIWLDLEKYIKQVATAVDLPYSALGAPVPGRNFAASR